MTNWSALSLNTQLYQVQQKNMCDTIPVEWVHSGVDPLKVPDGAAVQTLGLRDLVGPELQIVMRLLELRLLPMQHLKEKEPLARPPSCLLGSSRPEPLAPPGASRPMLWCAPLPVGRISACADEPAPAGETHPPERATLTSLPSISAQRGPFPNC